MVTTQSRIRSVEETGKRAARTVGLRWALVYATAASLWILFSDRLVSALRLSGDTELFVNSLKGEGFVLVTGVVLYIFTTRHLKRLYASEERHQRLFEHSTEGLMMYRVQRDEDAELKDLVIVDVNPMEAARLGMPRQQVDGMKMSEIVRDERLGTYFEIVASAARQGRPIRKEIHLDTLDVDEFVLAYPLADDLYALASMDMTGLKRAQQALRDQEEWIREAYVDVLDAVTGGKLVLLTPAEMDGALGDRLMDPRPISSSDHLAEARSDVRHAVEARYPEVAESMNLPSALGEALNNVLKHAGHGMYDVFAAGSRVQVRITDEGPGIDFRTLPKATLVAGFSTAATLGMGFTIMLQLADRVLISTQPGRTTVVLEFSANGVRATLDQGPLAENHASERQPVAAYHV